MATSTCTDLTSNVDGRTHSAESNKSRRWKKSKPKVTQISNNLYHILGPKYKPFPEEEASVANLVGTINSDCRLLQGRLEHERKDTGTAKVNLDDKSGADCSCCAGSVLDKKGEIKSWRDYEKRYKILLEKMSPTTGPRSVFVTAAELQETLRLWHTTLKLENVSSCTIALQIYQRRVRTLDESMYIVRGFNVRLLLAVSLWVAVKLVDNIDKVPKASSLAATAGVPVKLILFYELPLLDALHWNLVCY